MGTHEKRHIPRPQIPSGKYLLKYLDHWTFTDHYAKQPVLKLVILFQIIEGDYAAEEIARIYNIRKANGKRVFYAFAQGDLWTEFCAVMEGHLDTTKLRRDELPISKMKGLRIKAKIRAMKKNRKGVGLVGGASYSVVKNLLGSEPDDDGSITLPCRPLPKPKPLLIPKPKPSDPVGEPERAKATEKALGKNGGVNGESKDSDDAKRKAHSNFIREIEKAEPKRGDLWGK